MVETIIGYKNLFNLNFILKHLDLVTNISFNFLFPTYPFENMPAALQHFIDPSYGFFCVNCRDCCGFLTKCIRFSRRCSWNEKLTAWLQKGRPKCGNTFCGDEFYILNPDQ